MKKTKVLPFQEKVHYLVAPKRERKERNILTRQELLRHFVREGTQVIQGLDNLGNFLMGFGVLILGYLLNVNLKNNFAGVFRSDGGEIFVLSLFSLLAWSAAILFLLGFIYLFVFHMLAGRAIYSSQNNKTAIGDRISIKKMTYENFESKAPNFEAFVSANYLLEDQKSDEQIWYATFRYTRYMAFRKLMVMNKMRELLGLAMVCGVAFKLLDIFVQAL